MDISLSDRIGIASLWLSARQLIATVEAQKLQQSHARGIVTQMPSDTVLDGRADEILALWLRTPERMVFKKLWPAQTGNGAMPKASDPPHEEPRPS